MINANIRTSIEKALVVKLTDKSVWYNKGTCGSTLYINLKGDKVSLEQLEKLAHLFGTRNISSEHEHIEGECDNGIGDNVVIEVCDPVLKE